ncbi:protein kinase domain-containing protein [Polyangium jinanense]|uniref:Protein kinase n=1 Tax=Polyangium jinanense TaxID=2829994 RepID=A0A9X3XGW0_9BACT|nr:protein kinase [Polyangium jinanense]MDC3958998.1 protein kinase [Polyangium jinanense]MDC3988473.1 protein kinase [Polyangium jinanense]
MSTFQRFDVIGTTPHRHEREGLEWLRAALPTYDPHGAVALFSFQTDDGRRYEVDAVALTSHCLYVVELKSWRGKVIEGDARHLVTHSRERGREVVDHPLPLLETKTKAFMDRVRRVARRLGPRDLVDAMDRLWAEPLVWLTHADGTDLGSHDAARSHLVVGRSEIGDAIRQASFPGARDDLRGRSIPRDTLKLLRRVLGASEFGLGKIDKSLTVLDGRFDLAELVEEGDNYQDHWAVPHGVGPRCRVRSYLTPKSDRAFVDALERRVKREADVLLHLGDHPDILALEQLDPKGPLGPAIVFRGFPGKTLDVFLKQHRGDEGRSNLDINDKLAILRRVADALAFCHRADVVHGALSPEAVLVHRAAPHRAGEHGPLEVKLTRFALAASGEPTSEGTRLFTRLAGASASLYEAPEVARGVRPTPASDMFSLGALAYFLLAEAKPAATTVELTQRLARDAGLLISAVRDDLFPPGVRDSVDAVLWEATSIEPTERVRGLPTPLDFIDRLEEALTTPEAPVVSAPAPEHTEREIDPLDAVKGDTLGGDLRVLGELGSGATARVFKIDHPREGEVALKVPLSDAHDERIAHEAEVLEKLRRMAGVDRIAHFIDRRTLAGRTCLLVQLAGDRTLADELRAEGALSLDYARRWGDDLLTALRSLEEAGVQHRDIKPANIGLTTGFEKGKKRLLLFDFSLSSRPAEDLGVGTPAYKDPELAARGRWDDAADRWAAAITLHEMFTGVRPAPAPASDPGAVAVRIESDRIDADVRDGLLPFLERAFRFSARERFPTADDMRDAFIRALHKVPEQEGHAVDEPRIGLAELKGLGPEARVGDLPLSTRQRNALDRMGIYTLHELAQLSSNRIGGVRGVGARTARSLVELADIVRKHLEISATDAPPPFFRGFGGARRSVDEVAEAGRLSRPLARRLVEAGLADSIAVASAPQAQVKNLVTGARKEGAREGLKDLTTWLEELLDAARPPSTLGAAVELVAPSGGAKGGVSRRRVRQYLGLEELEGFPRHGSMVDLARASGITRAAVSIDIGKARERWTGPGGSGAELGSSERSPRASTTAPKPRELAVLERVFSAVDATLAASASVVPLDRAAAAVLEVLPPEPDLSLEATRHAAEALVRAVTELDAHLLGGPEGARLKLRRASQGAPAPMLVARDRSGFDLADRLGREADALVEGGSVVAEAAAAARLREMIRAEGLGPRSAEQAAALPDRALVGLAAATATRARISARGELYPAGLPAERAIVLSAAALAGRVPMAELERRVRARYPDGARLPDDPAARERLAASIGLRFVGDAFVPNERTLGVGSTELGSSSSGGSGSASGATPAAAPASPAASAPSRRPPRGERPKGDVVGATATRVFDEELERASRDGAFRVLLWRGEALDAGHRGAPNAERVTSAVARRVGGVVHPLDSLLISAAEVVAAQKKLRGGLAPALEADARGPEGPAWARLVELMRLASAHLVAGLLASPRPRILTRLGLLGRYELLSAISDLAQVHREPAPPEGRAATLVVLPVFAGEGAVVEVGADVAERVGAAAGTTLVPVPGLLPHEILEVPASWVVQKAERRSGSQPPAPGV